MTDGPFHLISVDNTMSSSLNCQTIASGPQTINHMPREEINLPASLDHTTRGLEEFPHGNVIPANANLVLARVLLTSSQVSPTFKHL